MKSLIETRLGKVVIVLLRWLWEATLTLFLSLLLVLPVGIIVVEFTSLGPRFQLMVFVIPILALTIAILIRRVPTRKSKPKLLASLEEWCKGDHSDESKRNVRWKCVALSIFFVSFALCLAMLPASMERISRPGDADSALRIFAPIHDPGIDHNRLERTLAEFERARRSITKEWSVSAGTPPITLFLFQDVDEYRESRGLTWSSGYAECRRNEVVIAVPLEEAFSLLNEEHQSGIPMHEMVHGIMCQLLGQDAYNSIPDWFHEGMAKFHENSGRTELMDRALNRTVVWWERGNLLAGDAFCGDRYEIPRVAVALFYRTSWEFVRSLESRHGRRTINAIIDDVSDGASFEDSLTERLGGTCTALYEEWVKSL